MSHLFHAIIHSPFLPVPFRPGAAAAPSLGVNVAWPSRALRLPRARASAEKRDQAMEEQGGAAALGWAARDATGVFSPYNFSRSLKKRATFNTRLELGRLLLSASCPLGSTASAPRWR
ncbi:hypothetical protein C2845_PM04G13490 [Panicum miliaceum]|uniref:Uncharacterized protein n=1 Tax=Panicum miliaceum TaxID=4540 RepID=A0A3L6QN45_PANMI|nr:hypothetical protein C2845_PM04G13490 [Panicum miliaceum]